MATIFFSWYVKLLAMTTVSVRLDKYIGIQTNCVIPYLRFNSFQTIIMIFYLNLIQIQKFSKDLSNHILENILENKTFHGNFINSQFTNKDLYITYIAFWIFKIEFEISSFCQKSERKSLK